MKKFEKTKWIAIYIIEVIVYAVLMYFLFIDDINKILFASVALVLTIALTFTFMKYKQQLSNNKQLQKRIELLVEHYQPLENKLKEIDQFRHDARNVLSLVKSSVTQDDTATEMVNELLDYSLSFGEIKYCENRYVNLILSEKHKECAKNKIKFDYAVKIQDDLGIEDKDMCSCFLNLLENAISANIVDFDTNSKWVTIKANVIGNYLIIKQSNSSYKNVVLDKDGRIVTIKSNKLDHGYGLVILDSIAKKYNGYTEFYEDNGVFYSAVYLEIK